MSTMEVKVEGMDELRRALSELPPKVKGNVRKALESVVLDLRKESQKIVPHALGDLEGSAYSDAYMGTEGPEGFVSYDEPYAIVQHEDLEYKHAPGREAKYLEKPLKENLPKYVNHIKEAASEAVT